MPRLTEDEIYDIADSLGIYNVDLCGSLVEFANEITDKSDNRATYMSVDWGIEDAEFEDIECEEIPHDEEAKTVAFYDIGMK